ncbi:hypothetical protein APB26_32480 [Pseudomonas aeruginosa]|uniref:hypothetical protein n=1 Tax=Pseudomonas aeruginosa TaxID=287 RepID=UPI00071BC013|nr:hypothetical protein [Pseudomonas aeruginosa]KSQ21699.1 hypothetical protein APB26_32480 [Pseudomonas aeruginosa]RPV61371.1 hypothetical protein IPC838_18810 [Pseudomonas aeruginosa]
MSSSLLKSALASNRLQWLRVAGTVAVLAALVACGHGTNTQQLAEAVRLAMSKGPSEGAYKDLTRELKAVDADCERFNAISRCQSKEFLEVRKWADSELSRMLLAGAEQGEGWAIKQAFRSPGGRPSEELRMRVAERLLLTAKNDAAPASVQLQAGLIYKSGTYTPQNFAAATMHLQKAWLKGEVRAAGALEQLSLYERDPANAYLWAVRCVSPCAPSRDLGGYVSQLPPDQISLIQDVARDKGVLTVAMGMADER